MIDNIIIPGQKVDLKTVSRLKGDGNNQKDRIYSSKIYDVISEDTIELLMPMEQTKLILLPVDAEFEVCFYTDNGLYECTVRIIDRYKSNNIYLLLATLETGLSKYQRRDFFRYSCALDTETRELTKQEIIATENKEHYQVPIGLPMAKGVIVDISGGGLRFVSKQLYPKDSYISVRYHLFIHGGVKMYELPCLVLNQRELPNRKNEYEHRVKFINLNNDEREEIIQYIFEEERKNRRKERGLN